MITFYLNFFTLTKTTKELIQVEMIKFYKTRNKKCTLLMAVQEFLYESVVFLKAKLKIMT